MAHILGVGIATVDIINFVPFFPLEDSEIRATSQQIRRGGNVTNSLVVLSQLGHQCQWAGVWVDERDAQLILDDLANYQIDIQACHIEPQGKVPTSYITVNQQNGSRTIVHYRDNPEFSLSDFQAIDLSTIDWLHFEGRHVAETQQMLAQAKQQYPQLPISIELEKPRPALEQLFPQADVLLCSKELAYHYHYQTALPFLHALQQQAPQAILVCTWGDKGAYALSPRGEEIYSPAYPPSQVIDTVGAGDTFNAAMIDGLLQQKSLEVTLQLACQLAGQKCGQIGLNGLLK